MSHLRPRDYHPAGDSLLSADLEVGEIASSRILECPPDRPLYEAAQQMANERVSSILVVEDGQLLGLWTERDALALDFSSAENFNRPIREVMSSPVKTIARETRLHELSNRFRSDKVRHYVVVDEQQRHCGVVTQTDVVHNQGIEHYLHLRSIESVILHGLQLLPDNASLREVVDVMRSAAVDAVIIQYGEADWGIITERDLVRHVAQRSLNRPAGEIANRPLLTVRQDTSMYRVRSILVENRVRHVGVVGAGNELLGLVSFSDILRGMELAYVQELQQALREQDVVLNTTQSNLHLAEKVIENLLEGIMITTPDSIIVAVNPAFTRLTGYRSKDVLGKTPALFSSGRHDKSFYDAMWQQLGSKGFWQGEVWNRRKNGETYPQQLAITAIHSSGGELTHYAALFNDITELKNQEERIRQLAYYDALTNLPNRRLLDDRIRMAIAHAHRQDRRMALLFIDLDRFKRINDSLGHEVGDQLLIHIARQLHTVIRDGDTLARMGGDEFIAVLNDISDHAQTAQVARRMLELLQQPVQVDGHELVTTVSIGISIYPEDGTDADTLLRNADAAMYRAKGSGRNSYQLYATEMNARSLEHLALETAMLRALERNEFELYYQPILDARTLRVVSAEALLRWHHPELGLVMPGDFIPLAEESGIILAISRWVTSEAGRQLQIWDAQGLEHLGLSINIANRQFNHPEFCTLMSQCLEDKHVNATRLTLELTENMLMDDTLATIQKLNLMHEMGFAISLDDFGTGFSSLSHLRKLPLNELKIDRSFVRDIDGAERGSAIIRGTIQLAQALNLCVVAEGVETVGQMRFLQAHNVDRLQGFYFSKPVPAEEFLRLAKAPSLLPPS